MNIHQLRNKLVLLYNNAYTDICNIFSSKNINFKPTESFWYFCQNNGYLDSIHELYIKRNELVDNTCKINLEDDDVVDEYYEILDNIDYEINRIKIPTTARYIYNYFLFPQRTKMFSNYKIRYLELCDILYRENQNFIESYGFWDYCATDNNMKWIYDLNLTYDDLLKTYDYDLDNNQKNMYNILLHNIDNKIKIFKNSGLARCIYSNFIFEKNKKK